MNILLLFVSTLHTPKDKKTGKNLTSVYSAYKDSGDKRESYPYLSQLEPGSKYFFNKLAAKNEKFGRVIAFCTEKTLEGVSFSVDGTDISYDDISAYELYRSRMTAFLGGSDVRDNELFAEAIKKAKPELTITPTAFCAPGLYTSDELNGLFLPIEISFDGSAFAENISNIVTAITEQTDEHIDLYLNAQGGLRTNVQIINAVLNMLQSRSVTLKEVSSIGFESSRRENPLSDETEHYLINDLAAALDAFLEYGRGDMFMKYYARYKRIRMDSVGKGKFKGIPEQKIIDRIKDISDSIMLCNIKEFVKNIDLLRKAIDAYEISTDSKDRFFELIVNDIKASYGDLMTESGAKNLIAQTKWCLSKNLIQQALTLIESKTPLFLMQNGFLYYHNDEQTAAALSSLKEYKEPLRDIEHYVVKEFMYVHFSDKIKKENFLTDEQVKALADGKFIIELKTPETHHNTDKTILIGSNMITGSDKDLFFEILRKYSDICVFRNKINHGDENEIMKPQSYQKHIGIFLELLKKAEELSAAFPDYKFRPIDMN